MSILTDDLRIQRLLEEEEWVAKGKRLPHGGLWYVDRDTSRWCCPTGSCDYSFSMYAAMELSVDQIIDKMDQHYDDAHYVERIKPHVSKRGVKVWRARVRV
jgi:hypothetical protein